MYFLVHFRQKLYIYSDTDSDKELGIMNNWGPIIQLPPPIFQLRSIFIYYEVFLEKRYANEAKCEPVMTSAKIRL